MSSNKTKISRDLLPDLEKAISGQDSAQIFILMDDNSEKLCFPLISGSPVFAQSHLIVVKSGDENKNVEAAVQIWKYLSEHGANRKSLLINLGGGMITDLGGFAASTFKRGIRYLNVSTTLLGAVDAATGGKTGINFLGLKNEIGVFNPADEVLIHIPFFKTLNADNLRSGFAEMVKHALIDTTEEWVSVMNFNLEIVDFNELTNLVERSIRIKERVVEIDPKEQGLRKALNLGHTIGHAFETFSYRTAQPVLHGHAVIWGLLCELYLSSIQLGFPMVHINELLALVKKYYGILSYDSSDHDVLYELMTHDKKNDSGFINFTLLKGIGEIEINQTAGKEQIFEALTWLNNRLK